MTRKTRTTEDLRELLFDCMEAVKNNKMDYENGRTIAQLADKAIGTVKLELEYAALCSKLDAEGQDVKAGPLLLTRDSAQEGDQ